MLLVDAYVASRHLVRGEERGKLNLKGKKKKAPEKNELWAKGERGVENQLIYFHVTCYINLVIRFLIEERKKIKVKCLRFSVHLRNVILSILTNVTDAH